MDSHRSEVVAEAGLEEAPEIGWQGPSRTSQVFDPALEAGLGSRRTAVRFRLDEVFFLLAVAFTLEQLFFAIRAHALDRAAGARNGIDVIPAHYRVGDPVRLPFVGVARRADPQLGLDEAADGAIAG
jgi:hypothetical protein